MMRVGLLDFDLPHERMALRPAEPRDACPAYPHRFTGNLVDKPAADALGVTLPLSRRANETTITRTLRSPGAA